MPSAADALQLPPLDPTQALPWTFAHAQGVSAAAESVFLALPSLHLQIDVGDGASLLLGDGMARIKTLALTHAHGDHISGLAAYLGARLARNLRRGAGRLDIVYPAGDARLDEWIEYLRPRTLGREEYMAVRFHALEPGQSFALEPDGGSAQKERLLWLDRVPHDPTRQCAAVRITERRTKLTAEGHALTPADRIRVTQGPDRARYQRTLDHPLLVHTGDTQPLVARTDAFAVPPAWVGADVLVHDSTFLSADDRDDITHATVAEALETAAVVQPGHLILHHLSRRYTSSAPGMARVTMQTLVDLVAAARATTTYRDDMPVWLWHGTTLERIPAVLPPNPPSEAVWATVRAVFDDASQPMTDDTQTP